MEIVIENISDDQPDSRGRFATKPSIAQAAPGFYAMRFQIEAPPEGPVNGGTMVGRFSWGLSQRQKSSSHRY